MLAHPQHAWNGLQRFYRLLLLSLHTTTIFTHLQFSVTSWTSWTRIAVRYHDNSPPVSQSPRSAWLNSRSSSLARRPSTSSTPLTPTTPRSLLPRPPPHLRTTTSSPSFPLRNADTPSTTLSTKGDEGKRNKICFFTWSPDDAKIKQKMVLRFLQRCSQEGSRRYLVRDPRHRLLRSQLRDRPRQGQPILVLDCIFVLQYYHM